MPLDTGIGPFSAGFQRFCVSGVNPVADECVGLLWGYMHDPSSPPEASSFDDINDAATENEIVQVLSPNHAEELFGKDSQLAHAAYLYFCSAGGYLGGGKLYVMPLFDDGAATAAEYTITVTGPATAAGNFDFYIPANVASVTKGYYSVAVATGDTDAEIATAVAAEIEADPNSLFLATAALGVVTLVSKHAGSIMNNAKVLFNAIYGQSFPPGINATFASTVTGAGDADLATALGNLPDCGYNCWGLLTEDQTQIDLLAAEIADRWSCAREQTYGHLFHSYTAADAASIVTYGNATNDETRNIIANLSSYKYLGWMLAAGWTSRVCREACINPGRPVVRDNGCLECLEDSDACGKSIFSAYEQEQLVDAGIALWGYNRSGNVFITNNVTNWKYNASGDRDRTWTNTESRFIVPALVGVITRFNNTYYASSALVDNGVPIPAGSIATSPALYKAHLVSYLEGQEDEDETTAGVLGVLLNDVSLENDILVAPNTEGAAPGFGDCHRLDVLITANLIKQLLRIAVGIRVRPC